ncbi:hypothetical protein B0I37DRAFT_435780 [Chaetomium sp. MPI-CAGE-AT-0009]|nr:hypothetical protein B0I37DRAFT_435780 [Chaetomium sp. MPI-CAGE-AT-0009]
MTSLDITKEEIIASFRGDTGSIELNGLLHQSVSQLLGVSAEAAAALKKLGSIETVFDLATSSVFDAAGKIVSAARDPSNPIFRYGKVSKDLVRDAYIKTPLEEMPSKPIDLLASVPEDGAPYIATALSVVNVRDLALYPPYRTSHRVMNYVYFPESSMSYDPERPADLIPKSGEYPIEKVQYTTLLMGEISGPRGTGTGTGLTDVKSEAFKPLDLATLAADSGGFQTVAVGALLTFTQSWYAQAVTLGHLLHSVTLPPGESTRVAVIDWSRRSSTGETETITEADRLSSTSEHSRAISEVTSAVANESQSGFSQSNTNSTTTASAESASMDVSAPLGGLFGGPSGAMGTSSSRSNTKAHSDGYSTTEGTRHVSSSMLQNVNDRTHQNASSSRNRRASVVNELSQSEHESMSTRVIANYNHMHALSVQYYEVVQVFRVETRFSKADKVLFIPFAMPDFNSDTIIRRYQLPLQKAALNYEFYQAMSNMDIIELALETSTTVFSVFGRPLAEVYKDALLTRSSLMAGTYRTPIVLTKVVRQKIQLKTKDDDEASGENDDTKDQTTPAVDTPSSSAVSPERLAHESLAAPSVVKFRDALPIISQANTHLWNKDHLASVSSLLNIPILHASSNSLQLPTECFIEGGIVTGTTLPLRVVLHTARGAIEDFGGETDFPAVALRDIQRISIRGSSSTADVKVVVDLTASRNGVLPSVTIKKGAVETTVVNVKPGAMNKNIKQHLAANRMHYGHAIFRALDSIQIAQLLSGYGYKLGDGRTVPVSQVVEPRPIRYVEEGLDPAWDKFIKDRKIVVNKAKNDTFHSDPPTEVAAIQTGSRAVTEDTSPGHLSAPIINMTTPASLPDPAGTAAILAAIQNGNMFRDQSGLAATIGLTQAALQATQAGAATAGQQAGQNLANQLQGATERQKTAASMITDLAKTAASVYTGGLAGGGGGGSSTGGGGKTGSQQGALMNYFDKTQGGKGAGGAQGPGGGGGAVVPVGGGGSSTEGGGGATPVTPSSTPGRGDRGGSSLGFSQNPAALAAVGPSSTFLDTIVSKIDDVLGGSFGAGDNETAPLGARKAWPKLDPTLVLSRIMALRNSPVLFDQGSYGLCNPAVFFYIIIQTNPAEFESFARALYGGGIGFLGRLKVAPDADLRAQSYDEMATKLRIGVMPPQADWMLMCALRDSTNWIFDYEGDPDDLGSTGGKTTLQEMEDWFARTGWYQTPQFKAEPSVADLKALAPNATAGSYAILSAYIQLFRPTFEWINNATEGYHVVALLGPIAIDEAADTAKFEFWTYGRTHRLETSVQALR